MSLNVSYGILSARPCDCLDDRRVAVAAAGSDADAADAVAAADAVSAGVTKYDRGMYLLVVASKSAAS